MSNVGMWVCGIKGNGRVALIVNRERHPLSFTGNVNLTIRVRVVGLDNCQMFLYIETQQSHISSGACKAVTKFAHDSKDVL